MSARTCFIHCRYGLRTLSMMSLIRFISFCVALSSGFRIVVHSSVSAPSTCPMPLTMRPARLFRSPTAPPSTCCSAEISWIAAAVPVSATMIIGVGPNDGSFGMQNGSISGSQPGGVPMNPPIACALLLRELAELVCHLLQLQLRGLPVESFFRQHFAKRSVISHVVIDAHLRDGFPGVVESRCLSDLLHHDFVIVRSHVSLHGECNLPDVVALRVPVLDPRALVRHAERTRDSERAACRDHAEAGLAVVFAVVPGDGVDRSARRAADRDGKRLAHLHAPR